MIYYIYDNSYEGLLTAIYEAYYSSEMPDRIIRKAHFHKNLFAEEVWIETDSEKAAKVDNAIKKEISAKSQKWIYYSYLSEIPRIDTFIYRYLKRGFKLGKTIEKQLTEDLVLKIKQTSSKVGREKHRLLGLLRFRKLENGIYYGPLTPDYNVITLMAPHFVDRMADQNWIIHDRGRGLAVLYNQKEWVLTEIEEAPAVKITQQEKTYQNLWQKFFETVAVKGRENPRLQKQYMPKRYWKYLIEKVDST